MGRRRLVLAGIAAFAGATGAQTAPAAKPAPLAARSPVDVAALRFKLLMEALDSKQVDEPLKNVLFLCIYKNSMEAISDATTKVLAANKLDPDDTSKVLTVMAGVCGLRPGAAPAPKTAPQEKPSR
ncbi:MAG: hypothetical protein ABW048_13790 [Sphingobium sp.]